MLLLAAPASAATGRPGIVVLGAFAPPLSGFNSWLACCSFGAAGPELASAETEGAFREDSKGRWVKELVTAAKADPNGVSYVISPRASWYWGGKRIPVTYKDFVYTLRQIDDPRNDVASRVPYNSLDATRFTHKGLRKVTFFWRTKNCTADFPCRPYANWQLLFSSNVGFPGLFPSVALKGLDFNKIWATCICGYDGKPVSDGPFYLASYAPGQATQKRNPYWAGKKPALSEVETRFFDDGNVALEAMRQGYIDALEAPLRPSILLPLKNARGLTITPESTYFGVERLEFREGNAPAGPTVTKGASNILLQAQWFRQAIALGIDRHAIVRALYGSFAGEIKVDQDLLYFPGEAAYRSDFARWKHDPRKALAILKSHCLRGSGPSSPNPTNTKIWRCGGVPATLRWTWTANDVDRTTTEQLAKAELKSIGIALVERPLPGESLFGPQGALSTGDFDVVEFGNTGTGDPAADFYDVYRCRGDANETGFCSRQIDALLNAGNSELKPAKRIADFQRADTLLAASVPSLPLYDPRGVLIRKSNLVGMKPGPAMFSTMEDWHWRR